MFINIKTVTWERNIMGLFDFETKNIQKQNHTANIDCRLIRNSNETKLDYGSDVSDDNQSLACIYKSDGQFHASFDRPTLHFDQVIQNSSAAYLVVRTLLNPDKTRRGYRLKLGNIIKFGRSVFVVQEIFNHLTMQKQTLFEVFFSQQFYLFKAPIIVQKCEELDDECRICLENKNTPDNPLIQSCNCRGSIKGIHIECLKKCISRRIKQNNKDNVVSYKWKKMECDICGKQYNFRVQVDGEQFQLVHFSKPEGCTYVALQGLTKGTEGFYYLTVREGSKTLIGRCHDQDLQINETTVSRSHAWLALDENSCIRLYDSSSKFGTLIQLSNPIKIKSQVVVQVGRSLVQFSMKDQ